MTVVELIEHLNKFPPDLKVWVSDGGYCEGAANCIEPQIILAIDAALDGDEVDEEYFYYDEEDGDDVDTYAPIILNPQLYGYYPFDKGYSKNIILIKSTLDK